MPEKKRIGLVLEGGGARGIYTAGVLDVFMEHGITFDGVIGVSAGAVHGSSYMSGQKGRSLRYYKKYCNDPRFMSVQSFLKTGTYVNVDFLYHQIPEKLDPYDYEAFRKNNTPFYAVCSNVKTGKAEYIRITDMKKQIDILRSSASRPYLSKIVKVDEKKYLDGAYTDSIPIEAFMRRGYKHNVVVLTRDKTYRMKKAKAGLLSRILYIGYPAFAKALSNRHKMYNKTLERIEELELEGSVFVIRPSAPIDLPHSKKTPERLQELYNMGKADAEALLTNLKAFINQ